LQFSFWMWFKSLFPFFLLSIFWTNKNKLMRLPWCLCLYVCPPYQLLNASTNLYETWYVYHVSWAYVNVVFHKSLPLVHAPLPLMLLGIGSVNVFPWQWICATTEKLLGTSFCKWSLSFWRESLGMCVPLSLLVNSSVNTFLQQWRIIGGVISMQSVSYQKKVAYYFFSELPIFNYAVRKLLFFSLSVIPL
jgi:hypothetical protein